MIPVLSLQKLNFNYLRCSYSVNTVSVLCTDCQSSTFLSPSTLTDQRTKDTFNIYRNVGKKKAEQRVTLGKPNDGGEGETRWDEEGLREHNIL